MKSKLPQKLAGFQPTSLPEATNPVGGLTSFLEKLKTKDAVPNEVKLTESVEDTGRSPLMTIVDFMRNLRNTSIYGRILVLKKTCLSKSSFKYLLLNPASLFEDFIKEPRYIVLSSN